MLGLLGDRAAIELAERHVDEQSRAWGPGHPEVARALDSLGFAHLNLRQLDRGATALRRSLAIYERWGDALATEHRSTQLKLATAIQLSHPDEAETLLFDFIDFSKESVPSNPVRGEALSVAIVVDGDVGDVVQKVRVLGMLEQIVGPKQLAGRRQLDDRTE